MNLKTITLMGVISTAVVLHSCKKDDDKKEETPATSIEGTWKATAQTLTVSFNGQDSTMDMFADAEPCEKDDLLRFNADKTVTNLPGATKCDPNEPASSSGGSWAMSSDNKKLTLDDGGAVVADVVTLNASTLKIKITDEDNGTKYTVTLTYGRQ
jgi:hypothetical protein